MNSIKTILLIGRTGNGKSALANVITRTNSFAEGEFVVSETSKIQIEKFEEDGTEYRVIDTIGIGDTGMSPDKVLRKLALMGYSVKDGLSQILFVTDEHLENKAKSIYDLLEKIVFDKSVTKYTTIVRTRFGEFRNKEKCEKEKVNMAKKSENIKELVEDRNCKIIYVDNPPIYITKEGGVVDKEMVSLNEDRREDSRKILLSHLKSVCQGDPYQPTNLGIMSSMISEFMIKKEEFKKKLNEGKINKVSWKWKNSSLNKEITKRMIEHIGKIDPELKKIIKEELRRSGKKGQSVDEWLRKKEKRENQKKWQTQIEADPKK